MAAWFYAHFSEIISPHVRLDAVVYRTCRPQTRSCCSTVDELYNVHKVLWTSFVLHRMHDGSQLELNTPAYWQPVELQH